MQHIIVATLGATWQVIPEILAALLPSVPLLKQHPQWAMQIVPLQLQGELEACHIIASDDEKSYRGAQHIQQWWQAVGLPASCLQIQHVPQTGTLNQPEQIERMREAILRTMLAVNLPTGLVSMPQQIHAVLAGGRKTMSADLQMAAQYFGAQHLYHVLTQTEPLLAELKTDELSFWASALPPHLAQEIVPIRLSGFEVDHTVLRGAFGTLLDETMVGDDLHPISAAVQRYQHTIRHTTQNIHAELQRDEHHAQWRLLYTLPPQQLQWLKHTPFNPDDAVHVAWLRALPKSELHCHIGGIPTVDDLPEIATHAMSVFKAQGGEADEALQATSYWFQSQIQAKIQTEGIPSLDEAMANYRRIMPQIKSMASPQSALAVLPLILHYAQMQQLKPMLNAWYSQRDGSFARYEQRGELMGSTLLKIPQTLAGYCTAIHRYAAGQSLAYLELRGSPSKYSHDPVAWLGAFHRQLLATSSCIGHVGCDYRFIWILDRRHLTNATPEALQQLIAPIVQAKQHYPDFVVGIDIAGDENTPLDAAQLTQIRTALRPVLDACLPMTIHAGEGQPALQIWNAVYELSADRIGHGLTLCDDPALLAKVSNRKIAIELCPSSNLELCPRFAHTYPLRTFIHAGVAVTLNTDNPGISRTTLTHEFSVAQRALVQHNAEPLTWWEVLALIRQGFLHAMLPMQDKERLIKRVDQQIVQQVQAWF
jgi:adenosine deaminase